MTDETRRQRIRADKAEAELELLKNAVRKMLDCATERDGRGYIAAKKDVERRIK
jgi:hypothetical protein